MKLTRLFAASLAALSVASCSNEIIEDAQNGVVLNPGDALVELNLSSGITSYASDILEGALDSVIYQLYNPGTKSVIKTTPTAAQTKTKISFTVAAADMKDITNAKLLVAGNTKGFTTDGTTAIELPDNLDTANTMEIQGTLTNDKAELINGGLPASASYDLILKEGIIAPPAAKLKRVPGRLHVTSAVMAQIAGYTVKYTGGTKASLFNPVATDPGNNTTTLTYTVQGNVPVGTSKTEPVGYLYPTRNVAIEVVGGGLTKTATIPEVARNKNYAINIVPKPTTDGSFDFDVEIDEWESGGGDIDVDFTTQTLLPKAGAALPLGLVIENGLLALTPQSAADLAHFDSENVFGVDATTLEGVSFSPITTYAAGEDKAVSEDGKLKVAIDENGGLVYLSALYNYGEDKTYVIYCKTGNGRPNAISKFEVKVKGLGYPAGFTETFNGLELAHINTSGDIAKDIAVFKKVNAEAGSSFVEKAVAYAKKSPDALLELRGKNTYSSGGVLAGPCPKGFRTPSEAELYGLFGVSAVANPIKRPLSFGENVMAEGKKLRLATYSGIEELAAEKHYYIYTNNEKMTFIPGNSNMTAGNLFTIGGVKTCKRVIFWNASFEHGNSIVVNETAANSSVRCVKVTQAAL